MSQTPSAFSNQSPPLAFIALGEVWSIEKDDIEERLLGNDPDSLQTTFAQTGKDIEQSTGMSKSDQLGLLSLIPGANSVVMGVAALGAGLDLHRNFQLLAKADDTERLLELNKLPVKALNWDWAERLANHVRTWLMPRLEARVEGLNKVLKASQGHQAVTDRISLYEGALEELRRVLVALDARIADLQTEQHDRYKDYAYQSAEAQRIYRDAKQGVELSAAALLYDRAAAAQKIDEIEENYKRLKCVHFYALSRCESIACEGFGFCPQHLCFELGCSDAVEEKSRYCKEHNKQLTDVTAFMPKLLEKNGLLPQGKTSKPPGERSSIPSSYLILGGIVAMLVLIAIYAEAPKSSERAPAPAPAISGEQLRVADAEKFDDFARLTAAEIESRRIDLENQGELSGKRYQAYDEKIDLLKPRLKDGDRDLVVSAAKDIMVTMEARLAELKTTKEVVEKLVQIYQFIEANPSKLAPDATLATNTKRLEAMRNASQTFRQAVIDAEHQNATSRSNLSDVLAAR